MKFIKLQEKKAYIVNTGMWVRGFYIKNKNIDSIDVVVFESNAKAFETRINIEAFKTQGWNNFDKILKDNRGIIAYIFQGTKK